MRVPKGRRRTDGRRLTGSVTGRTGKESRARVRAGPTRRRVATKTDPRSAGKTVENLVPGRIQGHPEGYGFLIPDDTTAQDVFLSRHGIRPAMQGDRALVRVVSHGRSGRREGEVVKVLERGQKRLVGVYRRGTRTSCLVPHDKRISYLMTIPRNAGGGARDKDLVAAEITRYPTSRSDLEVSVVAR